MFLQIRSGNLQGLRQRRPHGVIEPGLDAIVEERHREASHDDRRGHGDAAEQHDQPDMQLRTGGAAPPLHPHTRQPHRENSSQQQQQRQIGHQQRQADARLQPERRTACQDDKRRQSDRERERGQNQDRDLANGCVRGTNQPCAPRRLGRIPRPCQCFERWGGIHRLAVMVGFDPAISCGTGAGQTQP